ncbi:hypothetical protein LWI29_023107 [Acer saccharum]|uniref:C2 domain-containing protein n=1 Tax=Acer saccharum TaxID=4024 RepID=A0AA39RUX0_ACESA|nr:hypothetical protein LWI29_023107 [Acer saccharum]
MFGKFNMKVSSKIEGIAQKTTSDPFVTVSVSGVVIARTLVISNSENPAWMQHFNVPVEHYAVEVHFVVKDSGVVGSQIRGVVGIPVEQLYSELCSANANKKKGAHHPYGYSSTTPGSSEPPSLSTLQISNKTSLTQYGSIKLDRANYLLWETMILPIIKGHKLDGYVLGTKLCPPEFLPGTTPGDTMKILNPDYEEWISHDQLLLGWLYSTMNPDIASQLMKKSTSKELWDAAKELSGSPISVSDLITQILSGLDAEYTPIVVQLSDKESLSWIEL